MCGELRARSSFVGWQPVAASICVELRARTGFVGHQALPATTHRPGAPPRGRSRAGRQHSTHYSTSDKALPGSAHIPSVARSEIESQCMWALGMPLRLCDLLFSFIPYFITVPRGIPSAHMHWASISDLATLGMWADPGSYAWYVGGPR